jgi:hypothetical protein
MTQDDLIEMWHKAWPDQGSFVRASAEDLEAFAKLVAAKERAIYDHDTTVLMNALWKSCGDDEEIVRQTIDSQGTLIRGEA